MACSARPRGGSCSTAADIAGERVAELAARVGFVFQNPDDQLFEGKVERRWRSGRGTSARSRTPRPKPQPDRRRAVGWRNARPTRTTSTSSARKLVALAASSPCRRRSSSSTNRRPARTRRASRASAPWSATVGRPDERSSPSPTTWTSSPRRSIGSWSCATGRVLPTDHRPTSSPACWPSSWPRRISTHPWRHRSGPLGRGSTPSSFLAEALASLSRSR